MLPLEEIMRRLAELGGWILEDNTITRTFEFANFKEAINFVNRLSEGAERYNHHPSITINYSRVTLSLTTHSARGLTEKDFELAAIINRI